jgi:hypothetical protein
MNIHKNASMTPKGRAHLVQQIDLIGLIPGGRGRRDQPAHGAQVARSPGRAWPGRVARSQFAPAP